MLIYQKNFWKLDDGIVLLCSSFGMKHLSKSKNEDLLAWKIKVDVEIISTPGIYFERGVEFIKEINLDADEKSLDGMLFKEIFTCAEGYAVNIYKFLYSSKQVSARSS